MSTQANILQPTDRQTDRQRDIATDSTTSPAPKKILMIVGGGSHIKQKS